MINPIKFKVSDNEITIYTQRAFSIAGMILLVLFLVSMAGLAYMMSMMGEGGISFASYGLLISLLPCLLLFFLGSKKIIVSEKDETIYSAYFLGKKPLARFSEIKDVEYVKGSDYSYRAFLKADSYGKGILLTTRTTRPNYLKDFERDALPIIRKMIAESNQEKQEERQAIIIENYRYYRQKGNIFILKRKKEVVWNIFLVLLALFFLYLGLTTTTKEFLYVPIPMFLVGLGLIMQRKTFDLSQQTFTHSFGFFFRKTYFFNQFHNFNIVRKTLNNMYDGTDVRIVFKMKNAKIKEVTLRDFRKTKKIDRFIQETKSILSDDRLIRVTKKVESAYD